MILLACLGAALLGDARFAYSQSADNEAAQVEYNVKLAFLCKFGRYMTWPAESADLSEPDTWVIGFFGEDPFRGELSRLAVRQQVVAGRTITARRLVSLRDYQPCHVLFLPKTTPVKDQDAAIRSLRGQPVLLVGETPGFAARGGCINFFLDEDKVRFEINPVAIRGQGLEASSQLLKLAKIVGQPSR